MAELHVKAAPGLKCPRETKAERDRKGPITDEAFVTVPKIPYYLRLLRDGSLVAPTPAETGPSAPIPSAPKSNVNDTASQDKPDTAAKNKTKGGSDNDNTV
jgi:hypothetical protein